MVEMAFVLGFLMMLLVGVVTSAIAFGQKNSLENASREASRFAATLPEVSSNLSDVLEVARSAAQGDLNAGLPGQFICVAYIDEFGSVVSLEEAAGVQSSPNTECFSDGLPAGEERVQVVTERDTEIQAVFFTLDVTLNAPAAARYERN